MNSLRALVLVLATALGLAAGDAVPVNQATPKLDGKKAKAARQALLREAFLDHFVMGVNAPKEWLAEVRQTNGARFEFSNDYLSGGVGHDTPWFFKYSTFVENRIMEDKALGMGAWFTWYMLSQSKNKDGLTYDGTGPAKTAPANAKDPALMALYFEWFKKTLIEAGKHPEVPVVFQIEPDEWCHLLLSAGLDPTKVDVKVGSCGMEELKGLPDNEIGYAQALARLRDQYAPMVLLACNPSGWDWQNSMSGAKMGAVFKQMCGDDYELAAFEFGDRDKGCNKPPPYGDASGICSTFPNHLQWIKEFHETTGIWVCMWQVALGNTYYLSSDNSPGHRCDNLAQFILEGYPKNDGIARYVAAGCCGWMFNAGQGECASVWDAKKDGITNPPAIPGNEGHKSQYPDDDGGFMRVFGGKYYERPFPILGKRKKPEAAAEADTAKTAPKPAQALTADAEVVGKYCDRLRARLRDEIAANRHPQFTSSRLHAKVSVEETSDRGLTLMMDGSRLDVPWEALDKEDLVQLAVATVRKTKPEDHALAAFFLFITGKAPQAEDELTQAIGCDEDVRRALHPAQ